MRVVPVIILLLVSAAFNANTAAQEVGDQAAASGCTQPPANGEPLLDSFKALSLVLAVGQEVIVRDDAGRGTRGKVVLISDSELVVARRQYPFPGFRPRKAQAFAEARVHGVDIVDSSWNGAALGAAVGATTLIPVLRGPDSDGKILGVLTVVPIAIIVGASIGGVIDSRINSPVYRRQPQPPRVTIAPSFVRQHKGILVCVRF
jgi:hypothetical protein